MAKKRRGKPVIIFKRDIRFGREERIKIPPSPMRPSRLHQRSLLREEFISPDPWWWSGGRRRPGGGPVGEDPLEARAVSKARVKGTLPERIMYLALIRLLRFVPDIDFTFQSSLEGGRLEAGGIVADFIFPYLMVIIRVQGPTHTQFLVIRKDEEQRAILESMGYEVFDVDDKTIYNVFTLEEWLRKHFNIAGGRGVGVDGAATEIEESYDPVLLVQIEQGLQNAIGGIGGIA